MYEDLGLNEEDVVVLAVANPKSDQYPYNQDVSEDEVKRFLESEAGFQLVNDAFSQTTKHGKMEVGWTQCMTSSQSSVSLRGTGCICV